nr:hypothetical protein 1634Bnrm1_p104 [Cryptomonas sp.]
MYSKEEVKYIILEIPEFEKILIPDKIVYFNIFGIFSEKPVLRIDNLLFEGKWYVCMHSSAFYSKEVKTNVNNEDTSKLFLFSEDNPREKNNSKFDLIKLNCLHLTSNNFIGKRLRLYRIPLLITNK